MKIKFRSSFNTFFVIGVTLSMFLSPIVQAGRAGNIRPTDRQGKIIASLKFEPGHDDFGFANYTQKERDGRHDMGARDMVRMFGTKAVCKNAGATAANCVMKASAHEWMTEQLDSMGSGHCEGMAVACLRFNKHMPFNGKATPEDFQPGVGNAHALKLDPVLANYIAYYWATQSLTEIEDLQEQWRKAGPKKMVDELVRSMKAGDETYTFGICKRKGTECTDGHAITPFAVEDDGAAYKVHVYDNNDPGETKYLTIEKNEDQDWSYTAAINPNEKPDVYEGDKTTKSLEIIPTSKREGQCFSAPFDDSTEIAKGCGMEAAHPVNTPPQPAGPQPAPQKYADFFLTGEGDMLIVDENNKKFGYDPEADKYLYEITGGRASEMVSGKDLDMPHYKLPYNPKAKPYLIVFSGRHIKKESTMDFVFTGPGFSVGFEGIRLDPGELMFAEVSTNGRKVAMQMTKDGEMPEVFYAIDTPNKSYSAMVKSKAPAPAGPITLTGAQAIMSGHTDMAGFMAAVKKGGHAPNEMTVNFTDDNKIDISDNIEGDGSYDVDLEQVDAAGKKNKIQLKDLGKGDKGADNYQIEVGKWNGGSKIAVKHDDEGNGFDDDEEVLDENEPNDITDDPNKDDGVGALMSYLYMSMGV